MGNATRKRPLRSLQDGLGGAQEGPETAQEDAKNSQRKSSGLSMPGPERQDTFRHPRPQEGPKRAHERAVWRFAANGLRERPAGTACANARQERPARTPGINRSTPAMVSSMPGNRGVHDAPPCSLALNVQCPSCGGGARPPNTWHGGVHGRQTRGCKDPANHRLPGIEGTMPGNWGGHDAPPCSPA